MTRYSTVAEVIELHDRTIERTGVRPEALRDEGLLESAMMRAQSAAYYEVDLVRQAVLMAVGISKNKPFVDGNKRVAFGVLDVFLRINGLPFRGDPLELARHIERIAEVQGPRGEETTTFEECLGSQVESVARDR